MNKFRSFFRQNFNRNIPKNRLKILVVNSQKSPSAEGFAPIDSCLGKLLENVQNPTPNEISGFGAKRNLHFIFSAASSHPLSKFVPAPLYGYVLETETDRYIGPPIFELFSIGR